jgi:nucleotide-binding universal stress UspA family protein
MDDAIYSSPCAELSLNSLNLVFQFDVRGNKGISTVKIKPMLARLQQALGESYSTEQLVLLPGQSAPELSLQTDLQPKESIDFVVGYNGSANSQIALDLTLWIAHQTRLTTPKQVLVHVVYVLNPQTSSLQKRYPHPWTNAPIHELVWSPVAEQLQPNRSATALLTEPLAGETGRSPATNQCLSLCHLHEPLVTDALDEADCVLWQARCLAEEWRGSLEAHLRFGSAATELRNVVNAQAADLLVIGCNNKKHTLVKKLTRQFPCPVLGIPSLPPHEEL